MGWENDVVTTNWWLVLGWAFTVIALLIAVYKATKNLN